MSRLPHEDVANALRNLLRALPLGGEALNEQVMLAEHALSNVEYDAARYHGRARDYARKCLETYKGAGRDPQTEGMARNYLLGVLHGLSHSGALVLEDELEIARELNAPRIAQAVRRVG